ncbi:purine-cytosine permease family protein [Embleya hyalina]|uniref:Cytosine permease n=1 Tax=Embleya hyalina TaxID=516124 RepID=A0A401YQE7_9ACTN|nr:cytosine permease [Embleya hyalina]GCD96826.1 cytosine permease [Embleya hyalina]
MNVRQDDNDDRAGAVLERRGLEAVPDGDRHGSVGRVGLLWFAAQLVPTAFFLGALGATDFIGLGFGQAAAAIVVGTTLGALGPAALGLTGPTTGLATLAQARSPFGRGIVVLGPIAAFTSVAFIALGAIFGAEALQVAFGINEYVAIGLVFALEAAVSVAGYRVMHLFEHAMVVVVGAGFVAVTAVVIAKADRVSIPQSTFGPNAWGAFGLLAAVCFGFAFGWAHNAPDYCRYLPASVRPRRLFWSVFAGISLACVWIEILGLAAGALLSGSAPMASIDALMGSGAGGALVLLALYLGVVANATVAQYSAGLQMLASGVRLPRPVMTAVVAAVAFGLTLYLNAGDLAEKATNLILLATYWVGPFVGIWAVYLWRRPRGDEMTRAATAPVSSLPWRWNALVSLVAGYVVCLPFSNTTLGSELGERGGALNVLFGSVSERLHGADFAYPAGLLAGGFLYLALEGVGALRAVRSGALITATATGDETPVADKTVTTENNPLRPIGSTS